MVATLWCAKVPYASAAEASAAAHLTLKRRGNKSRPGDGLKVSAYKCEACGQYHWGHWGNKATPKRKNRRVKP